MADTFQSEGVRIEYQARGLRTSIKIEGLNQLRIAMQELPLNIQNRVLSGAVRQAALLIRDAARKLAPELNISNYPLSILKRRTPGLLRNMIRATRGIRRATEASAFVTVRRLSKKAITKFKAMTGRAGAENPNDPFYWSILEFGKSTRTAHPFLRPAFDTTKEAAAMRIKEALKEGIEREVAKLRKFKA